MSSSVPSSRTPLRSLIAATTATALVAGTIGVGLLLTPPPVATPPAAAADVAADPTADDLLRPATEVQQPPADPTGPASPDAAPGAPSPAAPLPADDPEQTVTVIVRSADRSWWDFEGTAARVERAVAARGDAEQRTNRVATVTREYSRTFTGFAIEVPRWALAAVRDTDGVESAFIERTYAIPADEQVEAAASDLFEWENGSSLAMTGADRVDERGDGMLISVIDTGLDTAHEAFSGEVDAATAALSQSGLDALRGDLGEGAQARYVSEKIPFAYDYADSDPDVTPAGASTDLSHGTHVAGIAAANGGDRIRGTAPGAQLMIQKVFDSLDGSARDSDILAALEDAAVVRPDVVNLSLGADSGFSVEEDGLYSSVFDALRAEGVIVVAAAGNSAQTGIGNLSGVERPYATDPDYGVIGAPASYEASLAVASIDNAALRPYLLGIDGLRAHYVPAVSATGGQLPALADLPAGDYPVLAVGLGTWDEVAPALTAYADAGGDIERTIMLIRRGGEQDGAPMTFQQKMNNVGYPAPAAVVFVDNTDSASLTAPALEAASIPSAIVSRAAGEALIAAGGTVRVDPAQVDAPSDTYTASWFTSMGVTPDLQLKPDVAAPGGGIFSAMPDGQYGYLSGTSMASPYLAGTLAVIKERLTEGDGALTDAEAALRASQLVMNTAVPVTDPAADDAPYTPRRQGAGLVNVPAALESPVSIAVDGATDPARPAASLGDSEDGRFTFSFTASNRSDAAVRYTLDANALSDRIADGLFQADAIDWAGAGIDVSFAGDASGSAVTVPANGSATVSVTIAAGAAFADAVSAAVNGTYIDGFVRLASADAPTLTVPYLGFYGDWGAVPVFDADITTGEAHVYPTALVSTSSGLPLGINPLDDAAVARATIDPSVIDPARAVVSPTRFSAGANAVQTVTGLLRNADRLAYELTRDADGASIDRYEYTHVGKSSFNDRVGAVLYGEAFLSPAPVFRAVDDADVELEPGGYTLTQTATTDGPGSTEQTRQSTFTYDNAGPRVEDVRLGGTPDAPALELTISDDTWLAAIDLQEYAGAGYFSRTLLDDPVRTDPDGRNVYEATIPVSDIRADWNEVEQLLGSARDLPSAATLYVWDYGLNPTAPQRVTLFESPVTGIAIDQTEAALAPAQKLRLTATLQPDNAVATDVVWSTDDESVVRVDGTGLATGVAEGTATITAAAGDTGFAASVEVTVAEIPEETGIVVSPATLTLAEGAESVLQALTAPSLTDAAVSWRSSDDTVATVDQEGRVQAVGRGDAEIEASVTRPGGEEVTATATVTVQQADYADYVIEDGVVKGYLGTRSVLDIPTGVAEIAAGAFAQIGATSVRVPASVEAIGDDAFREMPALRRVSIEDGQDGAPASRLVRLGDDVFNRSTQLTTVNLPDSVTQMGVAVFENTRITQMALPSPLTVIPERTFQGAVELTEVVIGPNVEIIGPSAFSQAYSLTRVALPDSLRRIEDGGFVSAGLREIALPADVERIGALAFAGNPLERIDLGGVEEIGAQAIVQTNIAELVLPDTLVGVGAAAFAENPLLEEVTIGREVADGALIGAFDVAGAAASNPLTARYVVADDVRNYRQRDGLLYDKAGTTLISYPRAKYTGGTLTIPEGTTDIAAFAVRGVTAPEVALPEGLRSIGRHAFSSSGLTRLVTPASLVEIGEQAFANNNALQAVTLTAVETVGAYAFAYDAALAELTLPDTLTDIGGQAFLANTALTRIALPDSVVRVGEGAFMNSTGLVSLHLGAGLVELGENALTGIPALRELTVAEANTAFVSDQDVLYARGAEGLRLMLYLPTKTETEYTVLDGTVRIGEQAFRGNTSLQRIVLPEGLRELGTGAFNSLSALREINMPDSLEVVDGFYFATALRTLDFGSGIRSFADFWSMGTDLEHLVVRGGQGASFADAFGSGGAVPLTAYFGPGITSVSYYSSLPRAIVVPADLGTLELAGWLADDQTRVYAPAGTPGWAAAEAGIVAAGLDPRTVLGEYTPLAVGLAVADGAAEASATGGLRTVAGEESTYEYRFTATDAEGTATVVRDWSADPAYTGPTGAALQVEARDATLLTAAADWAAGLPVVVTPPDDVRVVEGAAAVFRVEAAGTPEPAVQWQRADAGGTDWTDIPEATDPTLTIAETTLALDGTRYRAVLANEAGTVTSREATLTVTKADPGGPGTPGDPDDEEPEGTPAAPELTVDNRGTVSLAGVEGRTFRVSLGDALAQRWAGATLHSTPTFLGWQRADTTGTVTVTVPEGYSGPHRLSFVDRDGAVIGWIDIVVPGADGGTPEEPGTDPGTQPGAGGSSGGGSTGGDGAAAGGRALATTGADGAQLLGGVLLALAGLSAGAALLFGRRLRLLRRM